jgi:acetyltransferase-like isoleucine patch superfamily enzyme
LGESCSIFGLIDVSNKGKIQISDYFRANSGQSYNPIGGDGKLRLVCAEKGTIKIGKNVRISNTTMVCQKKIIIEDNVAIGGGCKIWDTNFHSLDPKIRFTIKEKENEIQKGQITIKKNAFIGASCTILKGVTIGENSIIGAGSVVSKNIPDNEIWAGNPIIHIRII